jgi:hypothetical protein
MGVGGQRHAPTALPPGKTRYPLYRRLGGAQGRSGQGRKNSPPPELDPRTVQPLASRYTDCANPAHYKLKVEKKKIVMARYKVRSALFRAKWRKPQYCKWQNPTSETRI